MSKLSEDPEMCIAVMAALVRRLGGRVTLNRSEVDVHGTLSSKFEEDRVHLVDEPTEPQQLGQQVGHG